MRVVIWLRVYNTCQVIKDCFPPWTRLTELQSTATLKLFVDAESNVYDVADVCGQPSDSIVLLGHPGDVAVCGHTPVDA